MEGGYTSGPMHTNPAAYGQAGQVPYPNTVATPAPYSTPQYPQSQNQFPQLQTSAYSYHPATQTVYQNIAGLGNMFQMHNPAAGCGQIPYTAVPPTQSGPMPPYPQQATAYSHQSTGAQPSGPLTQPGQMQQSSQGAAYSHQYTGAQPSVPSTQPGRGSGYPLTSQGRGNYPPSGYYQQ